MQKQLFAQGNSALDSLHVIEGKIILGNKKALFELTPFLNDKRYINEFLGHHILKTTPKNVAIRIIEENLLLTKSELKIDTNLNSKSFLLFLDTAKLIFDDLTGMFLITKLDERVTYYELKQLTSYKLKSFDSFKISFPEFNRVSQEEMNWNFYLKQKDPKSLLYLASAWYKTRARFNRYFYKDNEFLDLMKSVTHIDIGVPDEDGKITFLYKSDYYGKAKLNYLIYWVHHYKDYMWNENENCFINTKKPVNLKSNEEKIFELLSSENDSIAVNAFIQLSESNSRQVNALANDYEKNNVDVNEKLPLFTYKFLKPMTSLTQYCHENNINYKASGTLLLKLNLLLKDLSFLDRYEIENSLIKNLNPEEITAVEYFGLVNEQNWDCTYSIGRVLDKFYSINWNAIAPDTNRLKLFLKKAKLFDDLGIIGICNNYIQKFSNCSADVIDKLKYVSKNSKDKDIVNMAQEALLLANKTFVAKENKSWEGNKDSSIANLNHYFEIIKSNKEKDDKRYEILQLIGQVNYSQIGQALQLLKQDTILDNYDKYEFLKSDFGIEINSDESSQIEKFLVNYNSLDEISLYKKYLSESCAEYADLNKSFDFNKVYDILKFDVVDAFVGGGGVRRDDNVYLIIKLLELHFNTTLGFPKKLCSWQGMYACNCADRAKAWMKYLIDNKLVSINTSEPISIANLK